MTELDLWLHGTRTARLASSTRGGVELDWTDEALSRWGIGSRVLSHLLPAGTPEGSQHQRVRAWLEGLLPEGRARSTLASEHRIDPDDTVAFLAAYGADTAGAAVIVPAGTSDPYVSAGPVSVDEATIGRMLRVAEGRAGGRSRIDSLGSLAGMEPKIALTRTAGGWGRPSIGSPSTHILKVSRPPDSVTRDLIDTEAAALELARAVGVTTVNTHIEEFDGVRVLVVTRYDREVQDERIVRRHQEDLAQALGLATADPDRKFQRGRELPSYRAAARVLTDDGSTSDALLRHLTFTVLIGDTDAHAKNHSFLRWSDGTGAVLAPAYDMAMHLHSSASSGRLAMHVAGVDRFDALTLDDVIVEAGRWGVTPRRAHRIVTGTADAVADALGGIDHGRHPGVPAEAWEVVASRTSVLRSGLAGPQR